MLQRRNSIFYHQYILRLLFIKTIEWYGVPHLLSGRESFCQCRRQGDLASIPGSGKFPWRRKWQQASVFLPEKSHEQRMGHSQWDRKEANMAEHIYTHVEWHMPYLNLVSWNIKWNDVNSDLMEVLWGLKEEARVEACHVRGCVGQTLTDNGSFLAWSLEVQSLKNLISKTVLPVGRVNYYRQCSERQKSQSWVISRRS